MRITDIITEDLAVDARYATRAEMNILSQKLSAQLPEYRFSVEKKSTSEVIYIRIFNADKQAIVDYFRAQGLDQLPLEPEQAGISAKYRNNILSYQTSSRHIEPIAQNKQHKVPQTKTNAQTVIYTLVVASSGKEEETGVGVSIKEFTPTSLGLAGRKYTKDTLIQAAQQAVAEKTKTRKDLQQILLGLIDVAANGGKGTLPPAVNQNLSGRARNQLSVDFGEILAPILIAENDQEIEFPADGNFPLIDVIVNKVNYSVKSLTGSGTSFRSISDLMDNFEKTVEKDTKQEKLFALFKGYHPKSGGSNKDKILRAAQLIQVPELKKLTSSLGKKISGDINFENLKAILAKVVDPTDKSTDAYTKFLNWVYPSMTAGGWGKPVGLPQDGNRYMGNKTKTKSKDEKGSDEPIEKTAGYPSFRADPLEAAANIVTYMLGVATLNAVTRGPDADDYAHMMTNVVNQSSASLGRLDITDSGGLVVSTKPFSELKFKFQYHAPSHKPGNNLPGFMIVY